MTKEDVGWQLLINRWISKKQEREAELLRSLCDRYIGPTLAFLSASTSVPPRPGAAPTRTKYKALEHAVFTSEINMVETLIALVEVSAGFVKLEHIHLYVFLN
jgi:dynein heavy chain